MLFQDIYRKTCALTLRSLVSHIICHIMTYNVVFCIFRSRFIIEIQNELACGRNNFIICRSDNQIFKPWRHANGRLKANFTNMAFLAYLKSREIKNSLHLERFQLNFEEKYHIDFRKIRDSEPMNSRIGI